MRMMLKVSMPTDASNAACLETPEHRSFCE